MTEKEKNNIPLKQRLSWRSAKIAVTTTLLIGTLFAFLQVYNDINTEKERIAAFSNSTLIAIKEQASRAAYRLDNTVAQDITNGLLSFKGVKEAKIYDDFGDVLSVSKKKFDFNELAYIDQLLGMEFVVSSKELITKTGKFVGQLEIKILPAAFSPGFSQRTYGLLFSGFMKGAILSIILTISFHFLISRRILNAAQAFQNPKTIKWKPKKSNDEIDAFLQTVSDWKNQLENSKLKENRDKDWFKLAANSAGVGFWEWNLIDGKLTWDKNMLEMYCLPRKDFKGVYNDWAQFVHPLDKEKIEQNLSDFIDGKKPFNTEFRIITQPNKSLKYITADASIVRDEDGNPLSIVGINRDITSRKILQEKVNKSQHLESIGKLTGSIAHDFNNTFQAISCHAEFLQREKMTEIKKQQHLKAILRATYKSSDIIKSLLSFSRKQTLFPQVTEINKLIISMETEIRETLGNGNQFYFYGNEEPTYIDIDASALKEALMNLVENAKEAIDKIGVLNIKVLNSKFSNINYSDDKNSDYIEIQISDNGKGIPYENIEKIFDPFFTTKNFGQSGGLGLSMVYGFVKQSDGEITVSSTVGKGSTFKIIFPVIHLDQKLELIKYPELLNSLNDKSDHKTDIE